MATLSRTEWQGYYFDGRTPTRHPVTVSIQSGGLNLAHEDGTSIGWGYEEIRQTQGYHFNEPVRLERGGDIPEALVVADQKFLEAIHQVATGNASHLHNPALRSSWGKVVLVAGVGVILVGWLMYVWGIPALAGEIAARIPVSWEERIGRSVVEQMAPTQMKCPDTEGMKVLEEIVSSLAAGAGDSPYQFRVTVVKGSVVNAFAAPGGYLVIYEGLLRQTETPEELAGVLAHEIEHCLQRHPTRALFRRMSTQALVALLTGGEEALGGVLQMATVLGELRYSRRDEEAADRGGLAMIEAAKMDPQGMITFLGRLRKETAHREGGLGYFSTHPQISERIANLKRRVDQAQYTPVPLLPSYTWSEMHRMCEASPGIAKSPIGEGTNFISSSSQTRFDFPLAR